MDLRHACWRGDDPLRGASGSLTFPAAFMLVAAMRYALCAMRVPVRVVWRPDQTMHVFAGDALRGRYHAVRKISGPLLDRIDTRAGEPSAAIRGRACSVAARDRQAQRFKGTGLTCNADMSVGDVRVHCALGTAGQNLMKSAMRKCDLRR